MIAEFLNFWHSIEGKHLPHFRSKNIAIKFQGGSVDKALITGPEENSFALSKILIWESNKTNCFPRDQKLHFL